MEGRSGNGDWIRFKIHHQNELLKQRIYKDNKIYTSLNALKAAWYTAWDELSLEDVNECILGFRTYSKGLRERRKEQLPWIKGGYIAYK